MKRFISRMVCIITGFTILFTTVNVFKFNSFAVETQDVFEQLRARYINYYQGGNYDPTDPTTKASIDSINNTVKARMASMNRTPEAVGGQNGYIYSGQGQNDYIWSGFMLGRRYGTPENPCSDQTTSTYGYLRAYAQAYLYEGGEYYHSQAVIDDVTFVLEYLYGHFFSDGNIPTWGNWYAWQLGSPNYLGEVLFLLKDYLDPAIVEKNANLIYTATYKSEYTGANETMRNKNLMYAGVLLKKSEYMTNIPTNVAKTMNYVSSSDGFYQDGTYIQHAEVTYNGGYGVTILQNATEFMYYLSGTQWDIASSAKQNVFSWMRNNYSPFVYKNVFMEAFMGRNITRENSMLYSGLNVRNVAVALLDIAPETEKAFYKALIKDWSAGNFPLGTNIFNYKTIKNILDDNSITPNSFAGTNFQVPYGSKVVHSADKFSLSLSMYSKRIVNSEIGYSENDKGGYTGLGQLFLFNTDYDRYLNWAPTLDWFRLPGVTAVNGLTLNMHRNTNSFVGGTAIDKKYAVDGMEISPTGTTLKAKKSWFMFDDEVVALGSDISATGTNDIETTFENTPINQTGDNQLIIDDAIKPTTLGWSETINNASWLYMQGSKEGSNLGIYFPNKVTLNAKREKRTGKFADLGAAYTSTKLFEKNYLTFWQNHGQNPVDEKYAYVLLPCKTAQEVKQYSQTSDIDILRQDSNVHAVFENKLNMMAANIWSNTGDTISAFGKDNLITTDKACSLIVKIDEATEEMSVSVSDPTWENTGYVNITIDKPITGINVKDAGVEVVQRTPKTILKVNVNGARGQAIQAKLLYGAPQKPEKPSIISQTLTGNNMNFIFLDALRAEGYELYYGTQKGNYDKKVVSTTNSATVTDLDSLKTYYFAVKAVNAGGESEFSNELTINADNAIFDGSCDLYDNSTSKITSWQGSQTGALNGGFNNSSALTVSSGNVINTNKNIPVQANSEYTFRFWAKGDGNGAAKVTVSGTGITTSNFVLDDTDRKGKWYSASIKTAATTTSLMISVINTQTPLYTNGDVFIDEFALCKAYDYRSSGGNLLADPGFSTLVNNKAPTSWSFGGQAPNSIATGIGLNEKAARWWNQGSQTGFIKYSLINLQPNTSYYFTYYTQVPSTSFNQTTTNTVGICEDTGVANTLGTVNLYTSVIDKTRDIGVWKRNAVVVTTPATIPANGYAVFIKVQYAGSPGFASVLFTGFSFRQTELSSAIFHADSDNTIAPITSLANGSYIDVPTIPIKENYIFSGWYKDAAFTKPWSFSMDKITGETNLYAKMTFNGLLTANITNDISRIYDGQTVEAPTYTTNATGTALIEYKLKSSPDSAYVTTAPSAVGNYTVRVTIQDTDPVSATKDFTISYLETPITAYTLSGTKNNEWYSTNVTITPPTGYIVSTSLNGSYTNSITVSASQASYKIYLKNSQGQITDEIAVTEIKIDKVKPTGKITLGNDMWNGILNTLTFGLFFKETKAYSISADAQTSAVKIEYLKTTEKYETESALATATGWIEGNNVTITPNYKGYVYAKLTSEAGLVSYISSTGIVVYTDAVAVTQSISYTKTSTANALASVQLNGNTIAKINDGSKDLTEADYSVSDGTITFNTSYLNSLAAGTYTLTVSYKPMGEAYVNAVGNVAPQTTSIALTVSKATPSYTLPQGLTAIVGDKLQSITLPQGFSWDNPTELVGVAGTKTFKATYTPSDINNYNVITNLDVTVTVSAFIVTNDISKIYNGQTVVAPTYTTNATGTALIEYKLKSSPDSAYVTTAPSAVGNYTVRVTIQDTDPVSATKDFTISYLQTPSTAYTLSGTKNNEWYSTNVTITPPTGYIVSTSLNGSYTNSITVSASQASYKIYLKNSQGQMTDEIAVTEIKIDKVKPTGKITLGNDMWNGILNTLTFGLFFKETKAYSISADAQTSAVKIEYLKTTEKYETESALATATGWIEGNNISITPNYKGYVYAKLTSEAGLVSYISSTGIVVYTDAVAVTPSISYTKAATSNVPADVNLKGNTIAKINDGSKDLTEADYSVSDGTITFNTSYLNSLAAETYTLTVSYKPMGESYLAAVGNEAPLTTSIALTVSKATPSYNIPQGLTAIVGDKLQSITLPQGFSWDNPTELVGVAGTKTFKATYTPSDINNYNVITNLDVTVTVSNAPVVITKKGTESLENPTIILKGNIYSDGEIVLSVTPISDKTSGTFSLFLKQVDSTKQDILGLYEISLGNANYTGELTLTFNIGESYNGKTITVLHKPGNKELQAYGPIVVSDGKISITVPSLSPFMLTTSMEKNLTSNHTTTDPTIHNPKTSDKLPMEGLALILFSLFVFILKIQKVWNNQRQSSK